jgi:hypothetical protein
MAGLLEQLSMGLRSAGGIMDEGVYRGQRQEENIAQQLQEKRRDLMAQQVIRAAESGSMPPEVAQQALAQIGYKGLQVGPDAQAQQRQEEIKRREAIARGFSELAPEERANPRKIAEVFMLNGDHAQGAKYLEAAETRQARQEALVASLEQRRMEMDQRSQDAAATREQRAEAARQANELRAQIAQGQQSLQREGLELRRLVASQGRQMPQPQIVQTENGPMQVDRSGAATPIIDVTTGRPVTPRSTEKALPSSLSNKYLENVQNLRKAETAVSLLEGKDVGTFKGDKQATGGKGLLSNMGVIGDKALNWMDPAGVDTRAAIGDLGSMVIHDRSGAAVTAAEFPRLRPFIPLASDSPAVALKKSKRFVQEYKAEVEAQREFFSASGYKVPPVSGQGQSPIRQQADAILQGK